MPSATAPQHPPQVSLTVDAVVVLHEYAANVSHVGMERCAWGKVFGIFLELMHCILVVIDLKLPGFARGELLKGVA